MNTHQLTHWLDPKDPFIGITADRVAKVTEVEIVSQVIQLQKKAVLMSAVFVSPEYISHCKEYVENNCNIKNSEKV